MDEKIALKQSNQPSLEAMTTVRLAGGILFVVLVGLSFLIAIFV